jgi:DNA-binding LacI/PurR family transcriptional regulator
VLCTRTAGGLSEADYVDMLLEQHASGVVFAGGHFAELAAPHDHYRLLHSRGVPVVLINAAIDNLDFPCAATSASGWSSVPRTTCRRCVSWPRSGTTRRASA